MKRYLIIILMLLCFMVSCGEDTEYEPMRPEDREGFEKISADHTIIDEDVSTYLLIKNKLSKDDLLYSVTLFMDFEKGQRTSRYYEYYQFDYYLENDSFGTHYHDFDRIDGALRKYGQNFMPYYNLNSDIDYFNFKLKYSFLMKNDNDEDILYEKEYKFKEEIIKFDETANYVDLDNQFDIELIDSSVEGERFNRYKLNIKPKFKDEFEGHLDIQCFFKHNENYYPYLGLYHYNIKNGDYISVSDEIIDKNIIIDKLYIQINRYNINGIKDTLYYQINK